MQGRRRSSSPKEKEIASDPAGREMVGRTLSHYEIVEKLGEGGMGVVYRARDTVLHRSVAVKVLKPELTADPTRKRRFVQEARAASALSHPHIVTVHDIAREEDLDFIVMEYVPGRPLNELIPEQGLPVVEALGYARQTASAMAAAHAAGIIHRDLKPSNLRVTETGVVKVLDFGVAKLISAADSDEMPTLSGPMTEIGQAPGTAVYMSPEQARGGPVDVRSDIFSFGVVLYEMLTGQRPFQGPQLPALVHDICYGHPIPLRQLRPDVPEALGAAVATALAKQPSDRFQSAKALARALEMAACGELSASESRPSSRAPGRRLRLVPSLLAALMILVLAGLAVGPFVASKLRSPADPGPRPPSAAPSIAVLPLENLSPDPGEEYFADGMTEALITDLTGIAGLRVVSRTSVMRFKGVARPLSEIAGELQVDNVLDGSVLRVGGRVRINARLIEVATDRNIWAASYDRDCEDVLPLQSEVARRIAEAIEVELTSPEERRLDRTARVAPEAYDLYLRGRYLWNQRTPAAIFKSIELFDKAIETYPSYALAYTGLADAYSLLGSATYGVLRPRQAMPKAKAAASRALEIDPDLAQAHVSLGHVSLFYDWDFSAAERSFQRALELNSHYPTAHQWYGIHLMVTGRLEDSLTERRRARDLDPLSLILATDLASAFYYTRRYDLAVNEYRRVLELDPDFLLARLLLGRALVQESMFSDGIREYERALESAPEHTLALTLLGQAQALSGQHDAATTILAHLRRLSEDRYVPAHCMAGIHAALGERDEAFRWLERAYDERSSLMVYLGVEPSSDSLRSDPRFSELLRKVGL